MAAEIDITVVSKRVAWIEELPVEGPDYSAGTFAMEIRPYPGESGTALVSLTKQAAGTQGISCTYDPAYVDSETGETFGASIFLFNISEATMEGLAAGTPVDEPVECYYDLHVTPSVGAKFVLCYGKFTYRPGVTL